MSIKIRKQPDSGAVASARLHVGSTRWPGSCLPPRSWVTGTVLNPTTDCPRCPGSRAWSTPWTSKGGIVYSKIKLAGHPVHPMLVAFPIASYTGTLFGYAVYAANGHQFWLNLAIALNLIGVCSAAAAALPGLADWAFGIPSRSAAKRVGMIHAGLNVTALGLFL